MIKARGASVKSGCLSATAEKPKPGTAMWAFLAILAAAALLTLAGESPAADIPLPPVNLGDTSFQDAIAFPGWLVEETFGYYHASQFNDYQGHDRPGTNRLTTLSAVTHVAWISNFRLLGGFYGAEIIVPLADLDFKTEFGPKDRDHGLGDVSVSPFFIQWPEHKLFGLPFFQRLDILLKLPTGDYSRHSAVNVGNNVYSFNPYYAVTLVPAPRLEFSSRLHYLWNSENDDPYFRLTANNSQPGQAVHVNAAASYEIFKDFRAGVSGYALQQITDDKLNGNDQAHSKERVFGIGPGFKYKLESWLLYFNSYYEIGAENRPEGLKFVLRFSKLF
ncbi:MAG: transporter [Deltaproteobacteria bacterium]|nr:transporter [Deltaproteobacteria bacterium]